MRKIVAITILLCCVTSSFAEEIYNIPLGYYYGYLKGNFGGFTEYSNYKDTLAQGLIWGKDDLFRLYFVYDNYYPLILSTFRWRPTSEIQTYFYLNSYSIGSNSWADGNDLMLTFHRVPSGQIRIPSNLLNFCK